VTNAHVVEGEQGITVAFDNGKQVVTAKVVGADTDGDIAVLKIDGPVPAVAKFGDSSKLQIGETVIAIGAALGDFRNSVTKGVVSGLNRTLDSSPTVYVQTDAPINHGNSGGPLLNLQGEIIGINTAVLRSTPSSVGAGSDVAEGLGFAIPSNTVRTLSDQLINKGSVTRPYFGITYQMITPAIAGSSIGGGTTVPAVEGAWVHGTRGSGIVSGSPAERAGLKDNDVITAINGVALNDNNPLINAVLTYKPGDTVKLTVQRGNQTVTLSLTLGERPKNLN
jgi:2-alkenal reductase